MSTTNAREHDSKNAVSCRCERKESNNGTSDEPGKFQEQTGFPDSTNERIAENI